MDKQTGDGWTEEDTYGNYTGRTGAGTGSHNVDIGSEGHCGNRESMELLRMQSHLSLVFLSEVGKATSNVLTSPEMLKFLHFLFFQLYRID